MTGTAGRDSKEHGGPDVGRAAELLSSRFPTASGPEAYVVLGSGLSDLIDKVEGSVSVPFSALPGFPGPGVAGHAGRFVMGRLGGWPVLVQAGRLHLYEGHHPDLVVAPVRVAATMGAHTMVVTNAAGGIDRRLRPGDLMLIDDHVNLTARSPLAGPVMEGEERFPDMSEPYGRALQRLAASVAIQSGIPLARGTYVGLLGPSYETAAEIRMLDRLGGSAVGMSTVAEVITARALGLSVLGFSLITNRATGMGTRADLLEHEDVLEIGRRAGARLALVIESVLARLAQGKTREAGS